MLVKKNIASTKNLFAVFLALQSVFVFAQPANDLICNAISLSDNVACTQGTNVGATNSSDPTSCFTSSESVWYSFVATAADMTVSTDVTGLTLTNTEIAVYSSSTNTCTGSLTLFPGSGASTDGCDLDGGINCALCSVAEMQGLTVGNTYFIKVDGSSTATGTFCISAFNSYIPGSTPCEAQIVHPNSAACDVVNGNLAYNGTLDWGNKVGTNYCGCDSTNK